MVPVTRLSMGPGIFFDPVTPRFDLDATAGVIGLLEGGMIVGGELGYSFDTRYLNAFNLTGAIGFGSPFLGGTYRPRFLVGRREDGDTFAHTSVGMRNSAMLHFFADVLSFELGHQFMTNGAGGLEHNIHIGFGFNPASAIYLIAALDRALR